LESTNIFKGFEIIKEKMRKATIDNILEHIQYKKNRLKSKLLRKKYLKNKYFKLKIGKVVIRYNTEDKYSNQWFYPRFNNKQIHEPKVTRLLIELASKTQSFVDVGAHIGYFTCLIAKLFPNIKVTSFEMEENASLRLKKNVMLNNLKNVKINKNAVFDSNKEIKIKSINNPDPQLNMKEKSGKQITIKQIRLDSYFEKQKIKPDLYKIDVEGAELGVLKGMSGLMSKGLKIVLELHGEKLKYFNSSSKEVICFLLKNNFLVFEIQNHRLKKDGFLKLIDSPKRIRYNTILLCIRV
jgi:FkbM family methyltransferase